jgi:hypothetical protein
MCARRSLILFPSSGGERMTMGRKCIGMHGGNYVSLRKKGEGF